jgi:Family of unknown function (DUF6444)
MSCPLPQNACISPKAGERSVGPAGAAGLTWAGPWWAAAKVSAMGRAEAGAVCEPGARDGRRGAGGALGAEPLLARRVSELCERVAGQDERVAELERQLKRSCRNSSTPPSRDPPRAPERGRAPVCGRGRGARPGRSRAWTGVVGGGGGRSGGGALARALRLRAALLGARSGRAACASPARGAARDRRAGDRASAAAPALPGLWGRDARRVAGRGVRRRLRCAARGRRRGAVGPQPRLAPRHGRARR